MLRALRAIVDGLSGGERAGAGDAAVLRHYTSILEAILRLRQLCCAPSLVPPQRVAAARARARGRAAAAREGGGGGQRNGAGAATAPRAALSADEAARLLKGLNSALEAFDVGGSGDAQSDARRAATLPPRTKEAGLLECSVCLEELEASGARLLRGCAHAFCAACIERVVDAARAARPRRRVRCVARRLGAPT